MIIEGMTEKCESCTPERCCTRLENFGVVRGGVEILKDVNIHIHCGELTALIGPNGAGKSTLLKAMVGEIRHTGNLAFRHSDGRRSGQPLIGYVPQHLQFDLSSPVSVLDLFCACKSRMPVWLWHPAKIREEVRKMLERVQVDYAIERKIGALSGGELQRVLLALALDPLPDILLLDEPVSGIDINGMEMFYRMVSDLRKNFDMSIILVSHDLPLVARFADRVVFLNRTVVCSGTPEEVFSNEEVIKVFGVVKPSGNGRDKPSGQGAAKPSGNGLAEPSGNDVAKSSGNDVAISPGNLDRPSGDLDKQSEDLVRSAGDSRREGGGDHD